MPWPGYLQALDHELAHRPLDQLRAALRWSMLDSLADDLPAQLSQERFRFHAIPGAQRPARSQRCQLSTLKALGVELSRQFSLRALGSEARAAATRVVAGLRAPMAERVAAASWLSPEARAATAERVRKLDLKVGYPDVWPATGDFALRPDAHLDNVLAARSFEQTRIWRRALSAFRRSEWEMEVRPNAAWGMAAARLTIPNGFPDVDSNSMILTAAELEPPVFDAVAPLEVQYGTLGALTGHELVHLLEAYEYDAEGRVHDVWSKSDIAAHAARRQCLIDPGRPLRDRHQPRERRGDGRRERRRRLRARVRVHRARRRARRPADAAQRRRDDPGPAVLHRLCPGLVHRADSGVT